MIALVDINNCYVSCERRFNPKYERRPVIVLSNNDGCAIARSEEAKALGIRMGAAAFEIRDLIKQHNIVVLSSNYTLYADVTARLVALLESLCADVERYSIDEAFLDLSNMAMVTDMEAYGRDVRAKAYQYTKLPVCVGIAPSKTLAKAANRYAKKKHREKGVFVIDTDAKRIEVLSWMAVGDIWGIGHRNGHYFRNSGVSTALEFSRLSEDIVRKKMGVVGVRLLKELNGMRAFNMETQPAAKQNICTSRSFPSDIRDLEQMRQAVATHAAHCAEKLRAQHSCAGLLQVFIMTNRFRDTPQYHPTLSVRLSTASSDTRELTHYALWIVDKIYRRGFGYKKAGVIVADLVPASQVQASLFNIRDRELDSRITKAMDSINGTMGQDKIRLAAAGYASAWQMKRELLSPCYTTNFADIPKINCNGSART